MPVSEFVGRAVETLASIQKALFDRAQQFRDQHTRVIDSKEEFYEFFTPKSSGKPEIHGGFALSHWNGSAEVEDKIKNDLKVTIRCIPRETAREKGTCPFSGEPSAQRVVWAKSY
jgi:prolyl-tRNA synthetase